MYPCFYQMKLILLDGYEDVLIKVRDLVYDKHVLLTHPQASSLKPNQTPYRSVVVYPKGEEDNIKDIMLIDGEGKIYIFDKDGKRYDGWCTYKGNKYYIDETGSAHTGWIKIKGKWYYFHKRTAVMYKNCTVQNSKGIKYTFNSKGVCTNRK